MPSLSLLTFFIVIPYLAAAICKSGVNDNCILDDTTAFLQVNSALQRRLYHPKSSSLVSETETVDAVHSKEAMEVEVGVQCSSEEHFCSDEPCNCRDKDHKLETHASEDGRMCWSCRKLPPTVETCFGGGKTGHAWMLLPTNCEKDRAVYKVKLGDHFCSGEFGVAKKEIDSASAVRSTQGCANAVSADPECSATFYYGSTSKAVVYCVCASPAAACVETAQPEGYKLGIFSVMARSRQSPDVVNGCGFSSDFSKFAGIGFGGGQNKGADAANENAQVSGSTDMTVILSPLPGIRTGAIHDEAVSCPNSMEWDVPEVCIRAILNDIGPEFENYRQWTWSRSAAWLGYGENNNDYRMDDCNAGSLKTRAQILSGPNMLDWKHDRLCWDFIYGIKSLYCDAKREASGAPYEQICSHTAAGWESLSSETQQAELKDLRDKAGEEFFTPSALEWLNAEISPLKIYRDALSGSSAMTRT